MSINVAGSYEYSKKDLIGHGAFAVVFKGKNIQVCKLRGKMPVEDLGRPGWTIDFIDFWESQGAGPILIIDFFVNPKKTMKIFSFNKKSLTITKIYVELKDIIYHTGNGGIAAWIEDDFCDDINNKKECHYDGGDCCGLSVQNNFCVDCQCKCKWSTGKIKDDFTYYNT